MKLLSEGQDPSLRETPRSNLTLPVDLTNKPRGVAATLSRNAAYSLARVAVNSLVALVLPAYLTHHLPIATYGAWVLILQLAAFVSFLDFGVQTGVAKFVAEHYAKGDEAAASRYASAGMTIMVSTGLLGLALTFALAWQVPRLFQAMPAALYQDVRISVVLVGASLSFGLVCSVFSAIFLGLQRYAIPMGLAIINRMLFTAAILSAVFFHSSLAAMGVAAALANVTTGLLQVVAWRRSAAHIRLSLTLVDAKAFGEMMRYCSLLAVWTVGMVCVSGLDVTIVGHFAYTETAYYSVATMPINFILLIISSFLGPMMPATSALSTQRSPAAMGNILARVTRYFTMILLLSGLPLVVYGFPLLRLWVGPVYAMHGIIYLRILVLANIIRNLCAPYASMVAATGRQGAVMIAPISEAVVNLGSSIYLANRFGAMGVAFGTLLGSIVSVSLHFFLSMHMTRGSLSVSRYNLFFSGLCKPGIVVIPSLALLAFRWSPFHPMIPEPLQMALWCLSTTLLAWSKSLDREERVKLIQFTKARLIPYVSAE